MSAATSSYELKIAFNPPLDLAESLAPLGRWGDDGLDRWDGTTLARTARLADGALVPYAAVARANGSDTTLDVSISTDTDKRADQVRAQIARIFVDAPASLRDLAKADAQVARLTNLYPQIRPVLFPDPLVALIRSISAQQVNLRWAATLRRRIAERYGTRHHVGGTFVYSLSAEPLAEATVEALRMIQLTTAKSRSVIAVARAAQAGELEYSELERLDDEALIAHLTGLPGIGRWSAEWFLARTLGRPRVVAGDLGVRKAVARMYGSPTVPSEHEVRRVTAHWGESATFVQALALRDLAGAPPALSPARLPPGSRSSRLWRCDGRLETES